MRSEVGHRLLKPIFEQTRVGFDPLAFPKSEPEFVLIEALVYLVIERLCIKKQRAVSPLGQCGVLGQPNELLIRDRVQRKVDVSFAVEDDADAFFGSSIQRPFSFFAERRKDRLDQPVVTCGRDHGVSRLGEKRDRKVNAIVVINLLRRMCRIIERAIRGRGTTLHTELQTQSRFGRALPNGSRFHNQTTIREALPIRKSSLKRLSDLVTCLAELSLARLRYREPGEIVVLGRRVSECAMQVE
ncbi:hypothetical protein L6654_22545 [Bradyrhizobium sp. WYCCWR 13023]|uniref:Uncharacterized protein n=1 Tax=Bradyrhizobium zhengyangense TaxID=2911009 RepID=A0A9X1UBJ1_9BRAD|nr:hypothetical protein [Bradyrhizobium zhengyangense]MCG2644959.1 hypothetical protein [Bradyrhizobium zhengyangense]MCG2670928.1 hypothetical protein [Bradyrhizobium zhengyangense]